MMKPARVIRPQDCAHIITQLVQADQPASLPLYRGVREGMISAVLYHRGTQVHPSLLGAKRPPTVVVVGDDDHHSTGPTGWPHAEQLLRWANAVFLHGGAGEPEHYGVTVVTAILNGRLVFVETSSDHLAAWHTFSERLCKPEAVGMIFSSPSGKSHPARGTPAGRTTH